MFFDLNIKGSSYEDNLELANEAFKYGWEHVNFSYNQNNFSDALHYKDDLLEEFSDKIDYTLEIKSNNVGEVRKIANKFRNKVSCISVLGGDLKVNRATLENIQIDILSRPYLKRYDSGINHLLAKEAFKNNVAIEISFVDALKTYSTHRSKVLSNFKDIYTLYRKFKFPLILSSHAESIMDIRTPQDFKSFFIQTGLTSDEVDNCNNSALNILEFNKNRKNLILKGVRRVNDEA